MPTLILSGELDSITPIGEAQLVAAEMPDATLVQVGASTHVTALGDLFDCASVIAQRFVVDHDAGDTSCAGAIPPLPRVVGLPAPRGRRRARHDVVGRGVRGGPAGRGRDRRPRCRTRWPASASSTPPSATASAAAATGPTARAPGSCSPTSGSPTDLAVSGSVDANDEDRLQEGSTVSVDVTLDDGTTAELSWTLGGLGDAVIVTGTVDGRDVEAQARYA